MWQQIAVVCQLFLAIVLPAILFRDWRELKWEQQELSAFETEEGRKSTTYLSRQSQIYATQTRRQSKIILVMAVLLLINAALELSTLIISRQQ